MRYTVELDGDSADKLVEQVLRDAYETLEEDYVNRKNDEGCAIYHLDKKKDLKEIKKVMKAYRRVLSWFTV